MTARPWKAKGLAQETEGAYSSTAAGRGFRVLPASPAGCIVLYSWPVAPQAGGPPLRGNKSV